MLQQSVCAQKNHSNFEKTDWEEVRGDRDFSEDYKEKKEKEKSDKPKLDIPNLPVFGVGATVKYIILALVIGVLIFLIIKTFAGAGSINKNIKKGNLRYDDDSLDENIHDLDLINLLSEAISNRDFRSAIRIKFLIIIKRLSENGAISWKKDKTNWEYFTEIENDSFKSDFSPLISYYEKVWYGNIDLIAEDFNKLEPHYDLFINKVKPLNE